MLISCCRADDDDSGTEEKKERDDSVELGLRPSSSSAGSGFQTSHVFSSSLHGTIATAAVPLLERLVFRTSRGNAILRVTAIDAPLADPQTEQPVSKSVFTLLHVGEEMEKRLHRVLHAVGATEYDIPIGWKERLRLVRELQVRREDTGRVLRQTEAEIADALSALAWDEATQSSPYWDWMTGLQRERGVCEMLRRCEQTERQSRMLIAEAWLQSERLSELQSTLQQAVQQTSLQQAALQLLPMSACSSPPPTAFPTNAFTASFQAIVDTYGVPRYQEVNPGLFTVISFPFLFGVMYGDVGHGTLLTLSAAVLLLGEQRLLEQQRRGQLSDIVQLVFGGRYLMLMMGLFAVYCGLVYNDCFSIPLPLFASSWHWPRHGSAAEPAGGVYPFGVDWRWYHTANQLAFFNSMKMKMSVCIGVVQMLFGIALSACNCLYFREAAALWLECLPRLLFLLCTFGYMVWLILYKWTVDWTQPHAPPPANLIQTMIQMFLQPGSVQQDMQLYSGQAVVQSLLLAVALLSVPVMLLGVPLVERGEQLRKAKEKEEEEAGEEQPQQTLVVSQDEEEEEQPLSSSRRRKARTRLRKGDYDTLDSEDEDDEKRPRDEEKHATRLTSSHSSDSIARSASAPHSHPHALLPVQVDATLTLPATGRAAAANSTAGTSGAVPAAAVYSFSDALIHQSIHTIEFVLGCVSNTASYLRLWALSLAHAQLAEVFWSKMIQQYGLEQRSPLLITLGVAVWTVATIAVLLCMDVLECFLHALRLHWVESVHSRQAERDDVTGGSVCAPC